ncbi:MAG: TlpA family protein disulfide reductase [Myxococcales bacterium]|nr:TlpA family protein disulfide reductase [Myxococcales bacterium]MCB9641884.1 TlpA family protein disulfide reductase [Myxococcales bacterium]
MPSAQVRVVYLLCAVLMSGLWMQRLYAQAQVQKERGPARVGRQVPDLRFKNEQGQRFRVEALKGRWLMVNFWATWCEPCRREMPSLERLARTMKAQGLPIALVAASVDENWSLVHTFFRKHAFFRGTTPTMWVVRDPAGGVALRYGTKKFPETYLIDPQGRLRAKWIGALEWDSPRILARLKEIVKNAP